MTVKTKLTVAAAAALAVAGAANADLVMLDAASQNGGVEGNIGPMLQPVDQNGDLAPVLITARTMIDEDLPFEFMAQGTTGAIYVNDEGFGVQTLDGSGSKGISGSGGHQNEELVLSFDGLASASSIVLGFADFKPGDGLDDDDDTLVFVTLDGGETLVLDEMQYLGAFTYDQDAPERGELDFSMLSPDVLDPDALIASVTVRETHGHMLVTSLGYAIPAPGVLALLGLAGLAGRGSRRRRV